jgi:hypothetical protein
LLEVFEGAGERSGTDRLARLHPFAQVEEHGGCGKRGERHLLNGGPAVVEVVGQVDMGAGVGVQRERLGIEPLGLAAVVAGESSAGPKAPMIPLMPSPG